jgi:hypothetical protein
MQKDRWKNLWVSPMKKYKNSQMWWDIHLKYRKMLVKFKRFPEDEEELEDVLVELQEEKDVRTKRKEERKVKEK